MKTFSSSEEGSDVTDEDVENEQRLQKALLEKDKVSLGSSAESLLPDINFRYCNSATPPPPPQKKKKAGALVSSRTGYLFNLQCS